MQKVLELTSIDSGLAAKEFELDIDGSGFQQRTYLWKVSLYGSSLGVPERLYLVNARDISHLRSYQQQLALHQQIEVLYSATKDMAAAKSKNVLSFRFLEYLLAHADLEHDYSATIYFAVQSQDSDEIVAFSSLDLAMDGGVFSDSELTRISPRDVPWYGRLAIDRKSFIDGLRNLAIPVICSGELLAILRVGPCSFQWEPQEVDFYFIDTLAGSLAAALETMNFAEKAIYSNRYEVESKAKLLLQRTGQLSFSDLPNICLTGVANSAFSGSESESYWFNYLADPEIDALYLFAFKFEFPCSLSLALTGMISGMLVADVRSNPEGTRPVEQIDMKSRVLHYSRLINESFFRQHAGSCRHTGVILGLDLKFGQFASVRAGSAAIERHNRSAGRSVIRQASGPLFFGGGFDLSSQCEEGSLVPGDEIVVDLGSYREDKIGFSVQWPGESSARDLRKILGNDLTKSQVKSHGI